MKESDIVFESNDYWVLNVNKKGFEVYKKTITHSIKVASIGYTGQHGLEKAKQEIQRREKND
jgi:hypothetical protein